MSELVDYILIEGYFMNFARVTSGLVDLFWEREYTGEQGGDEEFHGRVLLN